MARVPSLASSEKIWQCYIVASRGEKNCSFAVFCYSFSTVIWILVSKLNCIPLQSFIFKILSFPLYINWLSSLLHYELSSVTCRQQHQLKMVNEYFSSLIEQPFLLNFYHLKCHIQCHLDY